MEAALNKEIVLDKTLCRIIAVTTFVILISLAAFVRIPLPFTPVPITLQTFFVLLSGAFLGYRLGLLTQLIYITGGISGLPIFANAGYGPAYLYGPTAGYLFGFVLASLFVAKFVKYAKDNFISVFLLFSFAGIIILCSGMAWLRIFFGSPLAKLMYLGFLPFITGDLLKAFCAAGIYLKLAPRMKQII